jgi:hypothetical protein
MHNLNSVSNCHQTRLPPTNFDAQPQRRPLHDTVARNAFTRFDTAVSKKYEKQLEDFNEEEYRKLAELKDLFDFLDDIIPEDDEEIDINAPKKGRSTRKRLVFQAGRGVRLNILQQAIRERHQQQYRRHLVRLQTNQSEQIQVCAVCLLDDQLLTRL